MRSSSRFQFGLGRLLMLPVLVAAFFAGWSSHKFLAHREYQRQQAEMDARREALLAKLMEQQRRSRDVMFMMIDRVEQQQRMRMYESLQSNPIRPNVMPMDRY